MFPISNQLTDLPTEFKDVGLAPASALRSSHTSRASARVASVPHRRAFRASEEPPRATVDKAFLLLTHLWRHEGKMSASLPAIYGAG